MAIRSFVGNLVCASVSGRPHRAAPTGLTEVPGKSRGTGGGGALPLHGDRRCYQWGGGVWSPRPTKGRGRGLPRRPCGPPRNDICHSEERSDVGVRSFPSRVQFPAQ